MRRVQNLLYEQGWGETEKLYDDMDRDTIEKIGHVPWGGFDDTEED
jgi:hypothetical protein